MLGLLPLKFQWFPDPPCQFLLLLHKPNWLRKKGKWTKKEGKDLSRRAKSRRILFLSQPRWLSQPEPNKGREGRVWKWFPSADLEFQARTPLLCWPVHLFLRIHQSVTLKMGKRAMWPIQWSKGIFFLETWMNFITWRSTNCSYP